MSYKEAPKSVTEVSRLIETALKTDFTRLDKEYNLEDRKMTGRLGMEMLHRILLRCNVEISWHELESAWKTFDLSADGLFTWRRFCQYYMTNNGGPPSANVLTSQEVTSESEAAAQEPAAQPNGNQPNGSCKPVPQQKSIKEAGDKTTDLKAKLKPVGTKLKGDFKKADVFNTGCLPLAMFGKILDQRGVCLTTREMYSLASKYDADLKGNINYKTLVGELK